MKKLILILALILLPSIGYAQDIDNPRGVTFIASSDHAQIDGYDVEIVDGNGDIVQTLDGGKPTPDATNTCTVVLNVQPIKFGMGYTIRVRARATSTSGPVYSDYAISVNKFNRRPGNPTKVTIG